MSTHQENWHFMKLAQELALNNIRQNGGGPFGAVIVKDSKLVSMGMNIVTAENDPTAHAEIVAIRNAGRYLRTFNLSGCVIYASCEPCPMCLAAIYWARLDNVYYMNTRNQVAAIGFDDDFIGRELRKPSARQRLKMRRIILSNALAALKAWEEKIDKIRY